MKYFDTISGVNSLLQWKETIIELRGPHPTEDSEILLCKMVEDIININKNMENFKQRMIDMVFSVDLHKLIFDDNDVNYFKEM